MRRGGSVLLLDVDRLQVEALNQADWPAIVDYAAALEVETFLVPRFTEQILGTIWSRLDYVLRRHDWRSVTRVQVRDTLPEVAPDWRERAAADLALGQPTNKARRERQNPEYPTYQGMTFGSRAEIEVYKLLVSLQHNLFPQDRTIAVMPSPTAQLRGMGLRTPDFVVVGNGRAMVIEVDGEGHRTLTRKADDDERDRQWRRCGGVYTYRITGAALGPA